MSWSTSPTWNIWPSNREPVERGDTAGVGQPRQADRAVASSGNQLSGEIPPELGNLANLEDLALHRDQLSGAIPPELGNLANLTRLDLSFNQLTGCVPSGLSGRLDMEVFEPGWSPVLPVRPRLTRPIAEINSPRRVQEARPRVLCALRKRPPPTGCRAMPAQARGLLDRPSIAGAQSRTAITATTPKDRWLIHLIPATEGAPAA